MTSPVTIQEGTDALLRSSWEGVLTPPQVWQLLNRLVAGSPFAGSLTRAETATGSIAFPSAAPTGFAWLAELEEVPPLVLDEQVSIVTVKKIAGHIPVSSEMLSDSAVNITDWVAGVLQDSLARDLDDGILRGSGTRQPDGIIAQADAVAAPTLTAAVGLAIAGIGEAGGAPDTLALSPTAYAAELTRSDSEGHLVHPDGLGDGFLGLQIVQVPGLEVPLCYDATRAYLVLGSDPQITVHDWWERDANVLLVKARANVGVPLKVRAIRKLEIEDEGRRAAAAPPRSAVTRSGGSANKA